jgi:hypothetical protein
MSALDKMLSTAGNRGFGIHPDMPYDKPRRMLTMIFIGVTVICALVIIYLAIAAISDYTPFNKRVVDYIPVGDEGALTAPTFTLEAPTLGEMTSVTGQTGDDLFPNCTYVRYYSVITDEPSGLPVSGPVYSDYKSVTNNQKQSITINAKIPQNFFIAGAVRAYGFAVYREIAQSNFTPSPSCAAPTSTGFLVHTVGSPTPIGASPIISTSNKSSTTSLHQTFLFTANDVIKL